MNRNHGQPAPSRPTWLTNEIFPFQSRWLEIDGHTIHYVDEGRGPTLLLVHGGPAWSFLFRHLIADLRRDHRCITLDLPGSGLSRMRPAWANDIANNAAFLVRFIEAIGIERFTPIVHDLGGPVTLLASTRMPERIEALAVTGSFGFPVNDFKRVPGMLRFVSGRTFGAVNRRFDLLGRALAGPAGGKRRRTSAEKAAWRGPGRDRALRNRWQPLFRSAVDSPGLLGQLEKDLGRLFSDRPVLLLYGEKDPANIAGFRARFQEIFPAAHTVILPGVHHFPHEEAPEEVIRAVRTWTQRTLAASPVPAARR